MSDSVPTTAAGWTRNAIHEINSGELSDARQMLAAALRLDPTYEAAWIWFGSIAENDEERRYCYQKALEIDPNSVVADRLAQIKTTESSAPPELADLEAPPLPEEFGGSQFEPEPSKRRWWPLVTIGAIVLGALLVGLWFLWPRSDQLGEPVYIAFVAGMTGPVATSSLEMQRGLDVYIDYVNENGGVNGRAVEFVTFDDGDNAEKAVEVANEIVADGRFVAVIGHRSSTASIAAAPIYAAASIPMISPTSTADALTEDCNVCFRTVFNNSTQGEMIASYIRGVLDIDSAVIVAEDSSYGSSLASGFATVFDDGGGSIEETYLLPADPTAADAIAETARAIAEQHPDTLIFLSLSAEVAQPVLIAFREAGIENPLFGGDSVSSHVFLDAVNQQTGLTGSQSATWGLYASSPVFLDSLTGEAVRLAARFLDVYGDPPSWRSLTTADAGVAVVHGLSSMGEDLDNLSIDQQRAAILESWQAMDSSATSIPSFIGPLYFDATHSASRPVAVGISAGSIYNSALRQLVPRTEQLLQLNPDIETIRVGDHEFAVKRVVLTGVDFSLIRDLDTVAETFYADFFIWFKYFGDDDAVDILLTNISDPQTLTVTEVRSTEVDGEKYKVFRVTGTFTSPLDFRSFPFDTQALRVLVQNQTLTQQELVYAIDSDFLEVPPAERLQSGNNATTSINQINNWQINSLNAFAGSVGTTSSLGDPTVAVATVGVEFSQVAVGIQIGRNVDQFLLKNLLPLVLLLAITYISLFFSHDQTTERVSFGITGVLTGAVLLSTVVSVLPDVGYTVAIEWAFYAFILLSALCILVALIGGRLNEAKQISEMRTLDLAARIGYPVLVALVVLAYWIVYA